jgi:FkbM family methyltransferase
MTKVKEALRGLARRAGYSIRRWRFSNEAAAVRARLLKELLCDLVLDVGAHIGAYGRELRELGYAGRIASFEPVASAFERLRVEAGRDGQWSCSRMALGDRTETAAMGVTNRSYTSSLLDVGQVLREAAPEVVGVGREKVAVHRLDELAPEVLGDSQRVFLKIDVQGYERRVLEGAAGCLHRVVAIDCEISLVELYVGQPLFREMIDYLDDLGFEPFHVDRCFSDESSGRNLQLNLLFVRRGTIEPGGKA